MGRDARVEPRCYVGRRPPSTPLGPLVRRISRPATGTDGTSVTIRPQWRVRRSNRTNRPATSRAVRGEGESRDGYRRPFLARSTVSVRVFDPDPTLATRPEVFQSPNFGSILGGPWITPSSVSLRTGRFSAMQTRYSPGGTPSPSVC